MTTEQPTTSMTLWQKIAAISKEVGHIEKTGNNSHFNYKFIEHSNVVGTLRPILELYGITIDLEAMDATFTSGDRSTRVLLHMRYTVTNADKPEETFSRLWVSEAMDQQDKGINKALTAAEKNVFMKLFHISDVDPDDDSNNPPAAKTSQARPQTATRPANQSQATTAPKQSQTPPQQAARPVTQPAPNAAPTQTATQTPAPANELATAQQRQGILKVAGFQGMEEVEINRRLKDLYACNLDNLSRVDASHFIKVLQGQA
jgi:hypothetical protein